MLRAAFQPARYDAFELLLHRLNRLKAAGLLPHHEVLEAAFQFDALCEGLVVTELRELAQSGVSDRDAWRRRWSQALHSLIIGFVNADTQTL